MLGQRRRRWANIETAMGECPVFAGTVSVYMLLLFGPDIDVTQQTRANVGLMLGQRRRCGRTLAQHWLVFAG